MHYFALLLPILTAHIKHWEIEIGPFHHLSTEELIWEFYKMTGGHSSSEYPTRKEGSAIAREERVAYGNKRREG